MAVLIVVLVVLLVGIIGTDITHKIINGEFIRLPDNEIYHWKRA